MSISYCSASTPTAPTRIIEKEMLNRYTVNSGGIRGELLIHFKMDG
jgi:hypothetical protein